MIIIWGYRTENIVLTIFLTSLLFSVCPLSPGSCQYNFKLTNHGQRPQRLYWHTDSFVASTQSHKRGNLSSRTILPPISTPKKKDILGHGSVLSVREKPTFSLSPSRVELFPGSSVDMVLTGSSDSPKVRQFACRTKNEQTHTLHLIGTASVHPFD